MEKLENEVSFYFSKMLSSTKKSAKKGRFFFMSFNILKDSLQMSFFFHPMFTKIDRWFNWLCGYV